MAVECERHQMLKVWIDDDEYKVMDTVTSPTVADVAKKLSSKLDMPIGSFDMLLEVGLNNGDKSIRKMDEDEVIQNTLQKHKSYNNRVLLSPRNNNNEDTVKDSTEEKKEPRHPPSHWAQVFNSVDNSILMMRDGNIPAHWSELLRSLDHYLLAMGQELIQPEEISQVQDTPRPRSLDLDTVKKLKDDKDFHEQTLRESEQKFDSGKRRYSLPVNFTPPEIHEGKENKSNHMQSFRSKFQNKFSLNLHKISSNSDHHISSPPLSPSSLSSSSSSVSSTSSSLSPRVISPRVLENSTVIHPPSSPSSRLRDIFPKITRRRSTSSACHPSPFQINLVSPRNGGSDTDSALQILYFALQEKRSVAETDES